MTKVTLLVVALTVFLGLASSVTAGQNDLQMTVSGEKNSVLAIVSKSMDAEFSDGQRTPWNGRTGYWTQFKSFFTGHNGVGIQLTPLAKNIEVEPSAFRLDFAFKSERGDGMRHVRALMEQIAKQASVQGSAVTISAPDAYRTMFQQADECFKKLETDPELVEISKKISLSRVDAATLSMLADDAKPTPEEKNAISAWAAKRDSCFNMRKIQFSYFPNDPRNMIAIEYVDKANQLIIDLFKGSISYGEFSQKRKAIGIALNKLLRDTTANINKEQADAQSRQADKDRQYQLEAQRIAVEQEKAQAMQIQANRPAPIQMPQMQIPTTRNCTSRAVAGTIETTCN